ncbi:flavin reductase family protein [Pseudoxanthomonas sp. PXM02]|uniref:flavin reductase family protein n=1 Tax=Pseudoxanthomonas sp. PXM02 TaxID=2769294 RepID=UPI00177D1A4C|nr:flavin reductase family protein [Pseudoxanthomonas sp. PXM02]MBD9478693.1 flavin reductase family protein [Pseudoxanthomonas sp. PXM02]
MSKQTRWKDLPTDQARRYLEPGPVVLLSTAHKGERAIMTLGWHMMLGYDLVGTYIWQANCSHARARASRECVINLPTEDLLDTVVRIGNCSSTEQDKFERFGLTALPSRDVDAPGIGECHARFECRLHETRITADYPLFVWRIVHARIATSPRLPRTVHYRGDGRFMVSGREVSRRRLFRPDMLEQ